MPRLPDVPVAVQEEENSCWACTSRMIINFYTGETTYASDQALANAWGATQDPVLENVDIDVVRSASAVLEDLGYTNNTDGSPVPSQSEISEAISAGTPLLANVATNNPHGTPVIDGGGEHWVVITGIDNGQLYVFDPAEGAIGHDAYNAATYQNGVYWQNSSYVDDHQ